MDYQKLVKQALLEKSQDKLDSVEKLLLETLKLNPNDYFTYNQLGLIYEQKKDIEKGISAFKKAISLEKNFIVSYYGLGRLYSSIFKYKSALNQFKRFLDLNGPNLLPNKMAALFFNDLGNVYYELGKIDHAINTYKKAIEKNKSFKYPYLGLGNVFMSDYKRDYNESLKYFEKAIEIDPNYFLAYSRIGYLYLKKNDYENAKHFFWKSIKIEIKYFSNWYGLSVLYKSTGQHHESYISAAMAEHVSKSGFENIKNDGKGGIFNLLDILEEHEECLFIYRIILKVDNWSIFINRNDYFKNIMTLFSSTHSFLDHAYHTLDEVNKTDRYLYIEGVFKFYLNDPIEAFRIFDEVLDTEENAYDMQIQYYLLKTSYETDLIFHQYNAISNDLNEKIEELLSNPTSLGDITIYYTALCCLQLEKYRDAIILLECIKDFIPAKIAMIKCQVYLGIDASDSIEQILSLNRTTQLLDFLNHQSFDHNDNIEQQALHFIYCKEIDSNLLPIQEYLVKNNLYRNEIDWESLSHRNKKPNLSKRSFERHSLQLKKIAREECKLIEKRLISHRDYYRDCFQVFLETDINFLEDKIGNRITEFSKSLNTYIELFIDTITYFNLSEKLNHNQKIKLVYWLYSQYYLSNLNNPNVHLGLNSILNLCIQYFAFPFLNVIPSILLPTLGELSAITVGKAIKKALYSKGNFPKTYDKFKEKVIELT